jgi:hypothetical protein
MGAEQTNTLLSNVLLQPTYECSRRFLIDRTNFIACLKVGDVIAKAFHYRDPLGSKPSRSFMAAPSVGFAIPGTISQSCDWRRYVRQFWHFHGAYWARSH